MPRIKRRTKQIIYFADALLAVIIILLGFWGYWGTQTFDEFVFFAIVAALVPATII
ncbi:hypothetical protein H5T51_05805, partial [Candidatus Bathyarchaeota archaeon]|nr:hypothetical protein [Candidatus Bathyarchaeota archaeon]